MGELIKFETSHLTKPKLYTKIESSYRDV